MPRGKIVTENPVLQSGENKIAADESNDNNNAAKFTLVEKESGDDDTDTHAESSPMHMLDKGNSNTLNFKFTLLLVALFVAVNIGLVALLDESKTPDASLPPKDENAVVKLPDAQAKTELPNAVASTGADEEKPVLGKSGPDKSAADDKSATDKVSSENPPAEKPADAESSEQPVNPPVTKQDVPQSGTDQDLLSIISKD